MAIIAITLKIFLDFCSWGIALSMVLVYGYGLSMASISMFHLYLKVPFIHSSGRSIIYKLYLCLWYKPA